MTLLKPIIPSTVIRFQGQPIPRIPPAAADTVAIPLVSDWGPRGSDPPGPLGTDGGPQLCEIFDKYTSIFGDSDTAGRTAAAGAFAGQSLPGVGGAGAVLAYRMVGASGAKASHNFNNQTPGAALTLEGKYIGSRGNRLTVTIDTDPSNAARDRLQIFLDGAVRETYLYANTDIATLAANINARSSLVTAVETITGVRMTAVSAVALTGGDDGATLTATDHLNALAALEFKPFGIIAPYNLTDPAIIASYVSWVQSQVLASRPVRLVVGGDVADTVDTALARSAACADEHTVNLGIGQWHDDLLAKDLSTAQLAPRVAGILAARGQRHSATSAKIGGLHAVGSSGPTTDEIETAIQGGVVTLMQISSPVADVKIAKGVTTFTDTTQADKPIDVYSDPRLVGIMDNYVRDMSEWGDEVVIGDLPVNDDSRNDVYAHGRALQDDLLAQGLILPGDNVTIPKPYVTVQNTDADPVYNDTIPYKFGWQFARTANAILGEGTVR